jgi:uncharacterized protein (DUF924 family)
MSAPAASPRQVLDFWFGLERPGKKDDPAVRTVLGEGYEQAARHRLDAWAEAPRNRLALILLLDQVPRHLYREDARAFATDLKAQEQTRLFFERGDWTGFPSLERFYAAMPYLHAEHEQRQAQVNPVIHACAASLPQLGFMGRIADLYLETIRRFGLFPHRNAVRGVPNSAEEQRFLDEVWYPRRHRIEAGAAKASVPRPPGDSAGGPAAVGDSSATKEERG